MNTVDIFERAVSVYYEALFRFAFSLTRTEFAAQDLTQQTFYVLATKGHQLRDIAKLKSWLFTTLHRAFLKSRQCQTRFPHQDLAGVLDEIPVQCPEPAHGIDTPQVLSTLAQVEQPYRSAVALFYLEDCSYKEIAAVLEVPVGTVKSRIARGISQLRQLLLGGDPSLPCRSRNATLPVPADREMSDSPGARCHPTSGYSRGAAEKWDVSPSGPLEPADTF